MKLINKRVKRSPEKRPHPPLKNSMKKSYIRQFFLEIRPVTNGNNNRSSYRKKIKAIIKDNFNIKNNDTSKFSIRMIFFFKREVGRIDLDNLIKPILDALTGIIYRDDTQVFQLRAEKRYNELIEGVSISIERFII